MKNLMILAVVMFSFMTMTHAQVKTPAKSPKGMVMQTVGLTDITINYARPSMKGRQIFGDLVPYGEMWRTGANKNTTIEFSTDVTIDGKEVPAGTYAIFTKPSQEAWEVMLYGDTENWGVPREWDDSKVVAMTKAEVMRMPAKVETFTITFDDLTNSAAHVGMMWEDVYAAFKVEVPTDVTVEKSIARVMNGPSDRDYYQAAVYYLDEGKDIQKAKMWVDKAVEMTSEDPKFWMLRQQSLIHAKAGSKETAIAAAKKSMELAEKAGNKGYVKMNMASLKEWGAM